MKIVINYDLLEEIFKEKHGFSLIKSTKKIVAVFAITCCIVLPLTAINTDHIKFVNYLNNLPLEFLMAMGFLIPFDAALDKMMKPVRELNIPPKLSTLPPKLKNLNINTNYNLLLESYKYKTEYEVKSEKGVFPHLVQKKYIIIPTLDKNKKEVSILQEHVVGSHTYTLSKGKPRKQVAFNLAFNNS